MTIEEIRKLDKSKGERFSAFASHLIPMPGTKKRIEDILNHELYVVDFRIRDSKHNPDSKCLQIQFTLDDEICVCFTGSAVLLDQISAVKDKLPFYAKIIKKDRYFSFE